MDEIPKINPVITCNGTPFKGKLEVMFNNVTPSLPALVRDTYVKDLICHGLRKSLDVWHQSTDPDRFILFDGHLEYQVAMANDLPFNINLHTFESENDVIRYLVKSTVYRVHMNAFQRGELVIGYKPLFTEDGKENMSKGGKGFKISKKVNTMSDLADMVGLSHDTLRKVETIINTLDKNDNLLKQLRDGEIKIHQAFELISGKKKIEPKTSEEQCDKPKAESEGNTDQSPRLDLEREVPEKSKFHIESSKKYQLIYMEPNWDLSDTIRIPDTYIREIQRMNIPEISYEKYCTLIVRVLSKFLCPMMNIIQEWGYTCTDTICISNDSALYTSKYSHQYHELLLVCEYNQVGVFSSLVVSQPLTSIITSENVPLVIDDMFSNHLSKAFIFTTPQPNGDTFFYNADSKQMICHSGQAC